MREITLQEVLDAREARAERQRRLLAQWEKGSVPLQYV